MQNSEENEESLDSRSCKGILGSIQHSQGLKLFRIEATFLINIVRYSIAHNRERIKNEEQPNVSNIKKPLLVFRFKGKIQ